MWRLWSLPINDQETGARAKASVTRGASSPAPRSRRPHGPRLLPVTPCPHGQPAAVSGTACCYILSLLPALRSPPLWLCHCSAAASPLRMNRQLRLRTAGHPATLIASTQAVLTKHGQRELQLQDLSQDVLLARQRDMPLTEPHRSGLSAS